MRRALEDEGNAILTVSVTVAEVVSKFGREGLETEAPYTAITTSSRVVGAWAREDAKEVGILHAAVKKGRPNFSLADAVVLQLARREKARVLTGDPDFRGIEEAVMIG